MTERAPGRGWLAFWSRPHRVYVDDRHRRVHYARLADDILSLLPYEGARVLDFGCGEALEAERVAARCRRLILCESAAPVRAELAARYAGHPVIEVIDGADLAGLVDGALDLVIVSSVLQYLTPAELRGLLPVWRAKLAPSGLLVLADVLPPESTALRDALALLRLAAREGFLWAALGGLASLALGDYRRLRRELGLTRWDPTELLDALRAAGLRGERRPTNLGFNPARLTILARPAGGSIAPVAEGPEPVGEEAPQHHEAGRQHLGGQVVQAEAVGEGRHGEAGQGHRADRHGEKARDRRLVRPLAREGPAPVERIGDRGAHEEPGEGGRDGAGADELHRRHEGSVVAHRGQHADAREAAELAQDGQPGEAAGGAGGRPQTHPPSQT